MAEERLRRNLDEAFDPGPGFPDPMLVSRTVALLDVAERRPRPRGTGVAGRQRPWGRLNPALAAVLVVAILVAAAGAFVAVQHLFPSPTPAKWGSCGGVFQCATVGVPLDYSHPGNGSIEVAMIRKPATDQAHRIGSLVFAVGGPALSGVDYLRANSVFFSEQFKRFDLVAFDQRGGGRSSAVHCLTNTQIDAFNQLDTVLDDPQEKQLFLDSNQALAQTCRQTSARLLPFLDTASAARDVDAIRAALGESKLTLLAFGGSTLLGQLYAQMFPTRIRAMVLDGVMDPAVAPTEQWRQRAAGIESNLQAFLADCRASVGCPLAASGDPGAVFAALLRRIDRSPMRVGIRQLGPQMAIAATLFGLEPQNWRYLDTALGDAARGDGQSLLALADLAQGRSANGTYTLDPDASTANFCADRPVPSDIAAYEGLAPAMAQASPVFGPAFQYLPSVCATWPVKARGSVAPLTAAPGVPVLVVGATHDPWWPYAAAQAVQSRLAGSVLLTRDGYGSISYFESGCVRLAVNAYLDRLTTPAPGTTCESDYPA